jgi:hypothetical protein
MIDRWKFLRKVPLFEEIELRLRHHWTGGDVVEWLVRENPQHPQIDAVLLDRFVAEQGPDWRLPVLVERLPGRRAARILALEEHTQLVRAQLARCRAFLAIERGISLPMSEVRANLELLGRLLAEQMKLQQALGYLPTQAAKLAVVAASAEVSDPEVALVRRMLELPADEFYPMVQAAFGPPGRRP